MPYREKEIEQIYWTIGEAANMVHRETSALRFWESVFYWIRAKKNKKGDRQYTRNELNQIIQVNFALSFAGLTIEGVIKAYTMGYIESLLKHVSDSQRSYEEVSPKYKSKDSNLIGEGFDY